MIKRLVLVVLIAMTAVTMSSASQKSGVDRLEWIAGCWTSDDGKERIEENWMIQIREVNGQLAYVVSLGLSAKPVIFKLIKNSDSEATFENPEHDFPQRIIYRRESADTLFARIEGQEKGVNKAMDFRYRRSRCD